MVRQIDWEERCWQLTHDVAVRLAIEAKETETNPVIAAGEAVSMAATTCELYREALAMTQKRAQGEL